MISQILAVTMMNLRSMPDRIGSSLVVVVGTAGVVGVLLSVLAMSNGLANMITNTGSGERVLVLREGATFEGASFIPLNETQLVLTTPGIARSGDDKPRASVEVVTSVNQHRRRDNSTVGVAVRGVDETGLQIRPDVKLVAGRMFQPGLREVIVGDLASQEFKGLDVGDQLTMRNLDWEVVGTFKSGDSLESGIITDATTMMAAFEQTNANSVMVVLEDGVTVDAFEASLTDNTTLLMDVIDEKRYYERAAGNLSDLMFVVTNVVAAIMAAGALFGALNTMYTAVSARGVEIATLRALGFSNTCVIISVLIEALVLAFAGAVLGASVAWLLFSGDLISISSIVFRLELTREMLITGIYWALGVGFLGGLFPAIRAVRLPIVAALREL